LYVLFLEVEYSVLFLFAVCEFERDIVSHPACSLSKGKERNVKGTVKAGGGSQKEHSTVLPSIKVLKRNISYLFHFCHSSQATYVFSYRTQFVKRPEVQCVHRTLEKLSPINLMCCFLKRVGLFCGGCSHMASWDPGRGGRRWCSLQYVYNPAGSN
jgi:hypothetical protein